VLNSDPKKLRFFGIDLKSRFRRRCAVVLTFAVFFIAMTGLSYGMESWKVLQRYRCGGWLMLLVPILCSVGIFREGGPVKAFNEPVWRLKGVKGGSLLLRSLDDRAEYRFGGRFDELPAAQQNEILGSYRVGNYFFPAASSKAPSMLDERERVEKDRAYGATLASLTRYLVIMGVVYADIYGVRRSVISSSDVAALLLTFGFIGLNGPKAAVLWNEPAPPSDGELRIVNDNQSEVS
jgi:hypothetical protein